MRARIIAIASLPFAVALSACPKSETDDPLTLAEAQEAVEESTLSDQAVSVVNGTVEITTNFTIGQAVEQAAEELRAFVASQLPCADIEVSAGTLSIEYGVKPGNCTYNGHSYTGKHTVNVAKNDEGEVLVQHSWDKISNAIVEVSGTADVTWSSQDRSRHVVHELTWTRLSDGREGTGSGDRTQSTLAGGIAEGIRVDGSRTWEGQSGRWDVAINSVEMRWVDPVPQSGSYVMSTPFGKSSSMAFQREDADTIRVTVSGGRRSFSFLVSKAGTATPE